MTYGVVLCFVLCCLVLCCLVNDVWCYVAPCRLVLRFGVVMGCVALCCAVLLAVCGVV